MSQPRNIPGRPSRPSHTPRRAATFAAALCCAAVAACSTERVTAPAAPASASLLSGGVRLVSGLLNVVTNTASDVTKRLTAPAFEALKATFHTTAADQEAPVDHAAPLVCVGRSTARATQRIGPAGGTLTFGRGRLVVPAGALADTVSISATATVDDDGVAVDFAPHGLQFAKAAEVTFNYLGCAAPSASAGLNVFYTNGDDFIVQTMPSTDDPTGRQIRALTDHFSGYTVSWGRSRGAE